MAKKETYIIEVALKLNKKIASLVVHLDWYLYENSSIAKI